MGKQGCQRRNVIRMKLLGAFQDSHFLAAMWASPIFAEDARLEDGDSPGRQN